MYSEREEPKLIVLQMVPYQSLFQHPHHHLRVHHHPRCHHHLPLFLNFCPYHLRFLYRRLSLHPYQLTQFFYLLDSLCLLLHPLFVFRSQWHLDQYQRLYDKICSSWLHGSLNLFYFWKISGVSRVALLLLVHTELGSGYHCYHCYYLPCCIRLFRKRHGALHVVRLSLLLAPLKQNCLH